MPGFYDLFGPNGFEVGEDIPSDLHKADSFSVEDFDEPEHDSFEVEEEPHQLIPGSEMEYIEHQDDDGLEVREKNWEEDKSHKQFIPYIQNKLTQIPRHSGRTIAGCERALAFLKGCDQEISQAMRSDLNGEIDEEEIEKIRKDIHNMMDRLQNRIDQLRKEANVQEVNFITDGDLEDRKLSKVAGTPVLNVYMTPFERAIVSTCINAKVSGGRNIEEVYGHLKNKYNFTPREELSFIQLIADHGYPIYTDRGLINEPTDPASGDNVEWQTNYQA